MKILSEKQQRLLLLFYDKTVVSFESQKIFKNKRSFERSVKELMRKGFLYRRIININEFVTTRHGEIIAKCLYKFCNEE